jgi:hypothetical protein
MTAPLRFRRMAIRSSLHVALRTGGVIVESHKIQGDWSRPTLAPFSGEWPDSSPAMSPDGSYLVFESNRQATPLTSRPKEGEPIPGIVSNLWRVDRVSSGWSRPMRLPDTSILPDNRYGSQGLLPTARSTLSPSTRRVGSVYFLPNTRMPLSAGSATSGQRRHHARCRSGDCFGRIVFGFLQRGTTAGRLERSSLYCFKKSRRMRDGGADPLR